MKILNKRSTSSPSLRGANAVCDVAIQRRCSSAFTLVELVIVIAIVIILSVVSVPIYRGYTNSAKMSEGYALLGTILSAQKAYYSRYGNFLSWTSGSAGTDVSTANDEVLGIDARGNKYFTKFYSGHSKDLKYYFGATAYGPEDLPGGTSLVLQYNITKGSRFGSTSTSTWI